MIKVENLNKSFEGRQVLKDINIEFESGKCNMIMAKENEISLLCSNMPHGYHREFQLLKDILFPALELMHKCLMMADYMLQHIIIKENILDAPIYDYLFTVEEVNRRTLAGMPFRDAYRKVGLDIEAGNFTPDKDVRHTHEGSIGNLCNEEIRKIMYSIYEAMDFDKARNAEQALLNA